MDGIIVIKVRWIYYAVGVAIVLLGGFVIPWRAKQFREEGIFFGGMCIAAGILVILLAYPK